MDACRVKVLTAQYEDKPSSMLGSQHGKIAETVATQHTVQHSRSHLLSDDEAYVMQLSDTRSILEAAHL
jgi:hypothetical protein